MKMYIEHVRFESGYENIKKRRIPKAKAKGYNRNEGKKYIRAALAAL